MHRVLYVLPLKVIIRDRSFARYEVARDVTLNFDACDARVSVDPLFNTYVICDLLHNLEVVGSRQRSV